MADENKEPRRFKLPSEFTDDERASMSRLGADGRPPERGEYVEWREETLRDEQDDLQLRGRLLAEQAEVLRGRADAHHATALAALSVEDHHAHLAATQAAREAGKPRPPLTAVDAEIAEWEQEAAVMEQEAAEIEEHAQTGAPMSAADHFERLRMN